MIRAPGMSQKGLEVDVPVSLIDIYPTLLDLCALPTDTMKSERGRPLDGVSMVPLLKKSETGRLDRAGCRSYGAI